MKKITSVLSLLLIFALLLSLGGCGKKEEPVEQVGAYTENETAPSDEDKEAFDKAVEGTEYADYTLVSTLGTQVVAGLNFKFLVETPDGEQKVMIVYRDLSKNCSVSSVEDYE